MVTTPSFTLLNHGCFSIANGNRQQRWTAAATNIPCAGCIDAVGATFVAAAWRMRCWTSRTQLKVRRVATSANAHFVTVRVACRQECQRAAQTNEIHSRCINGGHALAPTIYEPVSVTNCQRVNALLQWEGPYDLSGIGHCVDRIRTAEDGRCTVQQSAVCLRS